MGRLAKALRYRAGSVAAGTLDFFLMEHFEAQRKEMWRAVLKAAGSCGGSSGDGSAHKVHRAASMPSTGQQAAVLEALIADGGSSGEGSVHIKVYGAASMHSSEQQAAGETTPRLPVASRASIAAHVPDAGASPASSSSPAPPSLFLYSWDDQLATASKVRPAFNLRPP